MIFKSILIVVSIIQLSVYRPVSSDVPNCKLTTTENRFVLNEREVKYIAIDCKGKPFNKHMCDHLSKYIINETNITDVTFENCAINDIDEIVPNVKANITEMVFVKNNTFPNAEITFADGLTVLFITDSEFKTTPASLQIEASNLKRFEYNGKDDKAVNNITMVDPVKLEYFNLENTSVAHFPSDFFQNATNLKLIRLPSNKFESIDSVNLPNSVKWLDISMNKIAKLSNKSFENVEHLQVLKLKNNSINEIESGTFSHLNNLVYLSIEENNIAEVKKGMFDGLSDLRGIDLSFNKIINIEVAAFEVTPNITFLNLGGNNISHLDQISFNGMHRLQSLKLGWNPIDGITSSTFANMSRLHNLDLNDCKIKTVDFNVFASAWNLGNLDLSNNQIEYLVKMTSSQSMNNRTIKSYSPRHLVDEKFYWMDSVRYFGRSFQSENAKIFHDEMDSIVYDMFWSPYHENYEIPRESWRLNKLNLTANKLTVIEKDIFAPFKHLRKLHLTNNPITTLYPESFAGLNELYTLYMDHCKLTSIDFGVFAHSPKLDFLDLSHNQLATIIAVPMPSMWFLILNDNELTNFPMQKKDLPKLIQLDVQNNKLKCSALNTFYYIIRFNCNNQH